MSIEQTFERIALALEKLVELETNAVSAIGTVGQMTELKPGVRSEIRLTDWNPKTDPVHARYPQEKRDMVLAAAEELGVSTEGTTKDVHERVLAAAAKTGDTDKALEPEKPVEAVEPEEKPAEPGVEEKPLDLSTVRGHIVSYCKHVGRTTADGVALIQEVAGVTKLADVDPKFYAELIRRAGA